MNSKQSEWIAYVGPIPFPYGQAGSRRMCGIAHSLAEAGYNVVVGSGDELPSVATYLDEVKLAGTVRYVGLGESPSTDASRLQKIVKIFWSWGGKTVSWLDSHKNKPSHVLVYGGSAQYILRLLPWCRKNGVPLIVDVVEWYDSRHMTGGIFGPFNLSAKFALRYLYPMCDGVIAISQLLADYYKAKGCSVVRIPPTVNVVGDAVSVKSNNKTTSKMKLVYAGTPGKKDLLGNVIKAVAILDPLGDRLELLVIGPTLNQVTALFGGTKLPSCVNVLGKVLQSEVANYVRSADFSVLLREPLRFANAGFPTKFVESMANGTPVIANLTSDLGLYLHDGVEGLVCSDCSVGELVVTFEKALLLSSSEIELMGIAARNQAMSSFDFRVYAAPLSNFLKRN